MAVIGLVGVAACSGSDEPAAEPGEAEVVDETLPPLPPVATEATTTVAPTLAPTPTTEPPPTTSTTEPDAVVELGEWDWGAPCRVPVEQQITAQGPQVRRWFTLVVEESDDEFVMSFEDVVTESGQLNSADIAGILLDRGAVLADAYLDRSGRFSGFVDLEGDLAAAARQAGISGSVDSEGIVELIRHTTVDSWVSLWVDFGKVVPLTDEATVVVERLPGLSVPAEITRESSSLDSPWQVEEYGADAVGLNYWEFSNISLGFDARWPNESPGFDPDAIGADNPFVGRTPSSEGGSDTSLVEDWMRIRVAAGAQVMSAGLRPFRTSTEVNVRLEINGATSVLLRDHVFSTFDWENAEGCE